MVSIVDRIQAIDISVFINYNTIIFRKDYAMSIHGTESFDGASGRDFDQDALAALGCEDDPADIDPRTSPLIFENGYVVTIGGPAVSGAIADEEWDN